MLKKELRKLISRIVRQFNPWAPTRVLWDAPRWAQEWNIRKGDNRAVSPLAHVQLLQQDTDNDGTVQHGSTEPIPLGVTDQEVVLAIDLAKDRCRWAPAIHGYRISGARVFGIDGSVVSQDRQMLWELNDNGGAPEDHAIFRRIRFPSRSLRGHGDSVSLIQPLAGNYWHWMLETLPTLARLPREHLSFDRLILQENPPPFQLETLNLLGFTEEQLHRLGHNEVMECERLHAVTFRSGWLPDPSVFRWLQKHLLTGPISSFVTPRRIYVSRQDAKTRRASNEEDLQDLLCSYGFSVVTCGALSVREQAWLFHKADAIVGLHGAALTNLIFCRSGTRILEVFPQHWSPLCYFSMARLIGCEHRFLTAATSGRSPAQLRNDRRVVPETSAAQWADLEVPLDRLEIWLKTLPTEDPQTAPHSFKQE